MGIPYLLERIWKAAILAIVATTSVVAASSTDEVSGLHAHGGQWGFYPASEVNKKLPDVLLIGDSIVGGYRAEVIDRLKGKANVDVWLTPLHLNSDGLHEDLCKVASFRRYDVVHFNIGLHGWEAGSIPEGKYSELLTEYVELLKKESCRAKLIWARTTQVHELRKQELNKEINPTIVERNKLADEVMKEEGVTVNDLYGLMSDKLHLVRGDQWHWKQEAYTIMGKQTVAVIESRLSGSKGHSSDTLRKWIR